MKKTMILVCAHFDDELLGAVSLLLNFIGNIKVVFTAEGDYISKENYYKGQNEHERFTKKIQEYRDKNNLGTYEVIFYPEQGQVGPDGIPTSIKRHVIGILEKTVAQEEVDYYVYDPGSTHPSHCQNETIARGVLRIPLIYNVNNILETSYANEKAFPVRNREENVWQRITEEQMVFIRELYDCYESKLANFPLEQLEAYFKYTAQLITSGAGYAQGFYLRRRII
jgi:hypothetical protein